MQSSGKRLVLCAASMPRIVASTFSSDASTFSSDRYLQHQHTESDSTCAQPYIDDWHVGFLWGCFSVVRLHVVIAAAGKPLDSGVLASTVQSSKNMWSLESLEFEEHVVIAQWTFAMARSPIFDSRSVV